MQLRMLRGKYYNTSYNCNIWCDRVLSELDYSDADTKWNCNCVTNNSHPMRIEDACKII